MRLHFPQKSAQFLAMVVDNRRARFEYELLDTFTAGIVLLGWEVKSVRAGTANLKSAWVTIRDDEAFLENFSVSPWRFAHGIVQEQNRSRKLLLKKNELRKISQKFNETGHTIIPLKVFSDRGFLKCELAVARGRKKHEKRQVLKERSEKKIARQVMKNFNG